LAAGHAEHLALATVAATAEAATATVATTAATLGSLGRSTTWASAGLIGEALLLVIGLVISAKGEGRAAIGTGQGSVSEVHSTTSGT
jgi:hypothetical protein